VEKGGEVCRKAECIADVDHRSLLVCGEANLSFEEALTTAVAPHARCCLQGLPTMAVSITAQRARTGAAGGRAGFTNTSRHARADEQYLASVPSDSAHGGARADE